VRFLQISHARKSEGTTSSKHLYIGTKTHLKLFDSVSGLLERSFPIENQEAHCMEATCFCMDEDEQRLFVSGLTSQVISVWDLQGGRFLSKIPTLSPVICMCLSRIQLVLDGHKRTLFSHTLESSEGKLLFTGMHDATARSWEVQSGKCLMSYRGHLAKVNCIAVSGNILYTGSEDMTIRAWDILKGETLLQYSSGNYPILSMALIDGEHGVLFGAVGERILQWSLKTGDLLEFSLEGHKANVTCLSVQNHFLFSGSLDRTIRKWNIDNGECLHIYRENNTGVVLLAIDDDLLVSASADRTISCWDHNENRLFWGCYYGIQSIVQECIEKEHSNVDAVDFVGRSLLMIACANGHYRLAEYLIQKGARFDMTSCSGRDALYYILRNGQWSLLTHLCQKGHQLAPFMKVKSGTLAEELLKEKCFQEDKDFFRQLHECAVEFDLGYLISYAITQGLVEMAKMLGEDWKFGVERLEEMNLATDTAKGMLRDDHLVTIEPTIISPFPKGDRSKRLDLLLIEQDKEIKALQEQFSNIQQLFCEMQSSLSKIQQNQKLMHNLLRRSQNNSSNNIEENATEDQ